MSKDKEKVVEIDDDNDKLSFLTDMLIGSIFNPKISLKNMGQASVEIVR